MPPKPMRLSASPLNRRHPVSAAVRVYPEPVPVDRDIHFALEIGIVLKGGMILECPQHRAEIGPGDVWLCGIWEPHAACVTGAPCEAVVLTVLPQVLASTVFEENPAIPWLGLFSAEACYRIGTPEPVRSDMLSLGSRIRDVLVAGGPCAMLHIRLILYQIMLMFYEARGFRKPRRQPRSTAYDIVGRALELVLRTRGYVPLQQVAEEMGIDRRRLGRHFREVMGISLSEFSLNWRIDGAARELAETEHQVKRIAMEWGFTDSSHFNRVFTQRYRCRPIEYREQGRHPGRHADGITAAHDSRQPG
jgi:AraC-like DNA-binding protein